MIEISTIAARRLPIPNGCELHFIATASIGDASVSSAPVKPVVDHRLGSSVTFREPLVLPCYVDGSVIDLATFGITVHFRSVCGTMHLGTAVCRISKQWVPVLPTGEAMVSFSLNEPIPLSQGMQEVTKRQRPATAGPSVRSADAPTHMRQASGGAEDAVATTSEYSGSLTLRLKSIAGLAISTTLPVSLYVVAQFAMEEVSSSKIEVIPENDGHRGYWPDNASAVVFEVLPSNVSRIMTLSVFGAWVKAGNATTGPGPHHLLGLCKIDVPTNLGGENQYFSSSMSISGHPRSRLEVDVTLTYLKPRKEGAGGRPLSAYPRRAPGTSASAELPSGLHRHGSGLAASPPKQSQADADEVLGDSTHGVGSTAMKLRSKVGAGKKAWGDDDEGGSTSNSFQVALMAKLEESIRTAVSAAASTITERLVALEQRMQRTEEMITQLRPSTSHLQRPGSSGYGGARIPKAPSSLGGAASRPSSAESTGGYDVSHSIVTDTQLRSKFQEYDVRNCGYISVQQLIAFYRSNSAFGDDEDESKILKYFEYCGIRVRSSDGVSFDDFARLALKLAQR